jgi:two-component system cell cycle sensor histidine kinase/response regulator CckA
MSSGDAFMYDGDKELSELRAELARLREQVRAHAAYEASARAPLRDSLDIVQVIDRDGRLTYTSRAGLSELPPEALIGSLAREQLAPAYRAHFSEAMSQVFRTGQPTRLEVVAASGGSFELRLLALTEGAPYALAATFTDSAERRRSERAPGEGESQQRRLEEQLRQAQKMEALGQLTAGIAHNFNNMLTVILSNVSLCQGRVPEALKPRLRDAEHAARRAADMVRELMVFARRYPVDAKQPVDVREIVRRTCDICATTFDKRIVIAATVPETLPTVFADSGQLEQVLLNIALNARDALEENDTEAPAITFEVGSAQPGVNHAHHTVYEDARAGEVWIKIKDNGGGMSDEVRARVFEPFFTTKEIGRGTGLGLATAYGIVTDHGGSILCESELGAGSTFVVRLPAQPSAGSPSQQPRAANHTILVIEDEDLVRRTTAAVLAAGGYGVLEAESGEEGLRVFEREAASISLVLLDWSMPHMSGARVLSELLRIAPDVRVVLFSGQHPDSVLPRNVRAIIQKPSPVDLVLRTLRGVLGV